MIFLKKYWDFLSVIFKKKKQRRIHLKKQEKKTKEEKMKEKLEINNYN